MGAPVVKNAAHGAHSGTAAVSLSHALRGRPRSRGRQQCAGETQRTEVGVQEPVRRVSGELRGDQLCVAPRDQLDRRRVDGCRVDGYRGSGGRVSGSRASTSSVNGSSLGRHGAGARSGCGRATVENRGWRGWSIAPTRGNAVKRAGGPRGVDSASMTRSVNRARRGSGRRGRTR